MISYIQVDQLSKSFGEQILFKDISFSITENQRIGLIAKNGSGKTTLLNILSGRDNYDSGEINIKKDLKISYLDQSPKFDENMNVLEACFSSDNEMIKIISEYERIISSDDYSQLDEIMHQMDLLNAWDYEQQIKQILTQLKITNYKQKISELSGGQLKRVALANALICKPDLLILDEPTNHLDLEMTEWLEEYLNRLKISLLMVTHDRYFLDRICSEILEIDQQQLFIYKGNYSYFLEKREERINSQNSEIDKANNILRRELEWMRRQPKARGTKSKARIDAFYVQKDKAKKVREDRNIKLDQQASYIGNKIFEAQHIYKSFGELKILEDFNYVFSRYEKMGIVGNNGTGKSTFIKMLLGEIPPDQGVFEIGETIKFGYYSQEGLQFNEQMKVIDIITEIAEFIELGNGVKLSASQFLNHFLFPPEKQHNYVYKLSGGEKRRLYLCSILMKNPNFLILDEPTNDLDIMTLNLLEDYLTNFKGCAIIVSHDRYFMDKTVDHLLAFQGNAKIKDYPGNYTQYREWKKDQEETQKDDKKDKNDKKDREINKEANKKENNSEKKRKISYQEKKEFENLEKIIPELEIEKSKLEKELSNGNLSPQELVEKSKKIGDLIEEIEEKSLRWIELSEYI